MIYLMYVVSILLAVLCGYLFLKCKRIAAQGSRSLYQEIQKKNVAIEALNADIISLTKLLTNRQMFIAYTKEVTMLRDKLNDKNKEIADLNACINLLTDTNQELLKAQNK